MFHPWPLTLWITWTALPALVFLGRLLGCGVGAVRVSTLSGKRRPLAAVLGFLEFSVWTVVVFQMRGRLGDPAALLACALGFAAGTYAGIAFKDRFSGGGVVLRITTPKPADGLILSLGSLGVGVTIFEAKGATGGVNQLVIVAGRKVLPRVLAVVERYFTRAFYTVEEVAYVSAGARLGARGSVRSRGRPGR